MTPEQISMICLDHGNTDECRQCLEKALDDPQKPTFHATAPVFMMGDPNGLIQHKGVYHLFYQHTVTFAENPRMYWGHMCSEDLVTWEHLPIALRPDKYYSIASGSAVVDGTEVTAVFTGAEPQQQCIATSSDDDLKNWAYYSSNPVISAPPEGIKATGFRDPYVWKENDTWWMGVGSGIEGSAGTVFLYRSQDLRHWEYMGPLFVMDRGSVGDMFECPSLFKIGSKHFLTGNALPLPVDFSRMKSVVLTGVYANHRLAIEKVEDLDLFGEIWAPQVFRDEKGRYILLAFAWEARNGAKHGWSNSMILPRLLSQGDNGDLCYSPIPEYKKLRRDEKAFGRVRVEPESQGHLADCGGNVLEILVEYNIESIATSTATSFGVVICRSPDGLEQTRVVVDKTSNRIWVDRTQASLDKEVNGSSKTDRGFIPLSDFTKFDLHIFVDRSVIDVFVNDYKAGTTRIYPTRLDSQQVDLFSVGGPVTASSVKVWSLQSP